MAMSQEHFTVPLGELNTELPFGGCIVSYDTIHSCILCGGISMNVTSALQWGCADQRILVHVNVNIVDVGNVDLLQLLCRL